MMRQQAEVLGHADRSLKALFDEVERLRQFLRELDLVKKQAAKTAQAQNTQT